MKRRVAVWSRDGRGGLELSEPRLTGRGIFRCTATLTVEGEASSVELEMITPYRWMWLEYFCELADQLEGWRGRKIWESEFSELALASANDGSGSIEIAVLMQWPPTYEPDRRGTLLIEAADLVRIRDELRLFLRMQG